MVDLEKNKVNLSFMMDEKIRKKAKEHAKQIFDQLRESNSLMHMRGVEYIGASIESLESVIYSSMVDGAEIAINQFKTK